MSGNTAKRLFGLRLNWIGWAVLTGVLCTLVGLMLLFGGAYEMERSKSVNWAVIAGYILLLPAMLGGYVLEYLDAPATVHDYIGLPVTVLIQLPWYVFLFWAFRKLWRGRKTVE